MPHNRRMHLFEWARRLGQNPGGSANELQLLKMIAGARGATRTADFNTTTALRSIAASYGKSSGNYNELQSLRSIVDVLGATPAGRNLGDLNELDALRAIVGATAEGGGSGFSPDDITGLVLWLKADSLALSDGAAVSTWTDSSGNGNNATQGTAGKRPIYKVNIINGKPVVRFDATDDGLITTLDVHRPYTIFVVASQASVASTRLLQGGGSGENTLISMRRATNAVFLMASAVRNAAYGANGTAAIICLTVSAAQTTTLHHDGTDIADATPPSTDFGIIALGSEGAGLGASEAANGDIAQVLIYDSALSASDRGDVEDYLGDEYGITVA